MKRRDAAPAVRVRSTDLGALQTEAENAARALKAARTTLASAKLAVEKAEETYANTQKSLSIGVEQIKASTRVG